MPVDSGSTAERSVEPAPRITSRRSCQRVEAGFVPIVSQIPGFQEYLFVDAGDGAHLTISLYDDPSGAEQSTRDAAGWVRIHIEADEIAAATPST
jgi:hypothetical protein